MFSEGKREFLVRNRAVAPDIIMFLPQAVPSCHSMADGNARR